MKSRARHAISALMLMAFACLALASGGKKTDGKQRPTPTVVTVAPAPAPPPPVTVTTAAGSAAASRWKVGDLCDAFSPCKTCFSDADKAGKWWLAVIVAIDGDKVKVQYEGSPKTDVVTMANIRARQAGSAKRPVPRTDGRTLKAGDFCVVGSKNCPPGYWCEPQMFGDDPICKPGADPDTKPVMR